METDEFHRHISENSGLSIKQVEDFFIETYTGTKFNIFAPKKEDIKDEDIAHSLSRICRYNGHVDKFYTVAHHCLAMCWIFEKQDKQNLASQALLHDASEAYISDIPHPVKVGFKKTVKPLERQILDVIFEKYGLSKGLDEEIKNLDKRILRLEKEQLTDSGIWPWLREYEPLDFDLIDFVDFYSIDDIKDIFLYELKRMKG